MVGGAINSFISAPFRNEGDFEKIVLSNNILPGVSAFDAKKSLSDMPGFNRYPDIILFDNQYRYWSIGEVEIAEHSLPSHVFPQILEFNNLIERDLSYIKRQFLDTEEASGDLELRKLITYNKPFVTLVSDRFPKKYYASMDLLRSLCNVRIVSRFKDNNENYYHYHEEFLMSNILKSYSDCYVEDQVLRIERPSLVGLHQIQREKQLSLMDGSKVKMYMEDTLNMNDPLICLIDKTLRSGRYKIKNEGEKLVLEK